VLSLAPDSASASAGRKLASAATWPELGCEQRAVWGLARGSGKSPYQVAVDLSGPAYKCSCPSRKIPCKHVLGLLLLWAEGEIGEAEVPEFVAEWLVARETRPDAAQERTAKRAASDGDPVARERRAASRAASIADGCADLERWLEDLVRQGLATARERPASAWEGQARRLVDAQAPGLAGRVRRIAAAAHAGGDDWPVRALSQAALLYLATRAWARRDSVAEDLREDLRGLVGWPRPLEEVRSSSPPLGGTWAVAGMRVVEEYRIRTRRTWLRRLEDERVALLLDFAAGASAFGSPGYGVGSLLEGAFYAFPGRAGLRVVAGEDVRVTGAWDGPSPEATVAAALEAWGAALVADPFCERLAVVLHAVVPVRVRGRWWVREPGGEALALAGGPPWPLVALAGGRPVGVSGEWDGERLTVLCGWNEGALVPLGAPLEVAA
jgi:hypothetical protein